MKTEYEYTLAIAILIQPEPTNKTSVANKTTGRQPNNLIIELPTKKFDSIR